MVEGFYTYLHCKPNGDPFYVGKGSGNRAMNMKRRNRHHQSIVSKYGKERIGVFIFPCETEQQAFDDEIRDIAQLRGEGFVLANLTSGGEGVAGLSKKISPEQRKKLSIAGMGNKNCLGYRHTTETLKKMSASMKSRGDLKSWADRLKHLCNKAVICATTGESFASATQAARYFGIKCKSSVTKCCRGETKVAYGLVFKYQTNI